MRQTENKPCAVGALQRVTYSKCHAQLEATFDIIFGCPLSRTTETWWSDVLAINADSQRL